MSTDTLSGFIGHWLPKLDQEMRKVLRFPALESVSPDVAPLFGMMQYHMGWTDAQFEPRQQPGGKRLRPIFCLLACAEVGGDPDRALPAAAGLELLHNFSLVHDDIEDGDEVRHHRPTMWTLWGVPQSINTGDSMFALSYAALQRLPGYGVSSAITLRVLEEFTDTCILLTEGQYLDMDFEERERVQVGEYLRMIEGKTAALLGASMAIGAMVGGASDAQVSQLKSFGQSLGLAFQIQDDYLGIWGDPDVTGKAAGNDILRRKKSLPLLYALNHPDVGAALQKRWDGAVQEADIPAIMGLLEEADTQAFVRQQLVHHHENALSMLRQALGNRANDSDLLALANSLLHRRA